MTLHYGITVSREPDGTWEVTIFDQSTNHGDGLICRERRLRKCVRVIGAWLHDHARARP